MAAPKTRAGSGLTIRKNSDEVLAENVQDLDVVEGAGVQLTLTIDRREAAAKLIITSTGPSSDRHVEITAADTNPSGLDDKLVVTAPITKVIENVGGNELLRIAHGGQHDLSDILGTISAAQHGTIVSGNLHPEYATDVDLAGYALLAGRPLTANDLTLTTSAAAGTLTGSSVTGGSLSLKANAIDALGTINIVNSHLALADSQKVIFGTGSDASIMWNGTDLIVADDAGTIIAASSAFGRRFGGAAWSFAGTVTLPGDLTISSNRLVFGASALGEMCMTYPPGVVTVLVTLSDSSAAEATRTTTVLSKLRVNSAATINATLTTTSTITVGANSQILDSPAAGVMSCGGNFRVGTNVIQNSAGTKQITLATSNNTVRVNDRLGVNATPAASQRAIISTFPGGSASETILTIGLQDTLTTNRTARTGFFFTGTITAGVYNLTTATGISSIPTVSLDDDGVDASTLTTYRAIAAQVSISSVSGVVGVGPTVTRADAISVLASGLGLNAFGSFVTLSGVRIANQGNAFVTGTSIALDIEAQSGSGTATYSIRALGSGPSIHEPALLIGTTTAPVGVLDVVQSSTTGAKPVVLLNQADVDEDYLKIIGTSDTSADRALVDAANFTTPGAIKGWLKINVQDDQATNPIVDGDYYIPFYAVPTA